MHKARRSNIRHSVSPRSSLEQARSRTRLAPNDAAGWVALAYALHEATEHGEALIAAEKAVTLPNAEASAWAVLGKLHAHRGDWDAALPYLQRSINLDPHCYEANIQLADLYLQQNDIGKALDNIEAALEARTGDVSALSRKANILMRAHRYDEAIDILENLIKVDPGNFAHWNNLGNARKETGMLSAAEDAYLKGMKVGTDPITFSNRLTALHYWPEMDAGSISAVCKEWGATFNPSKPAVRPIPTDRSPSRPLRIGMFSDGFRQHPVGAMTTTALEHAAKLGIDVYAYTSSRVVDPITRRIIAISTKWTAIAHLTDAQFADLIRDDEIDILIDLSGHNAGTRMRTMAMAPAPILVKWVGGLINTTGVEAIDYLISDGIESPPGTDDMYTEKLIRMPDDYICYMPPKSVPKVGPLPALKNGYVTFGCFNNPTKVNDVVLAEWAKLLQQVPNSKLYLKGGPYASTMLRQRVLDTLARHGIEADRVRMEGKSPHYQLFESYNEVDVALDPWPYSGGLTTCEAMLMGVPVVTLPGPTFAGRHSATHLINAGMPELVVENWDQYRDRVLELVSDLNSLATIRSHLRRVLLDSPVCDSKRFARNLANALRAIWQRYCEGKPPAALTLDQAGQAQFEDEPAPVELHHPPVSAADQDDDFSFSFTGDIVVLDQGGTVTAGDRFSSWHQLGAFTAIAIDPTSMARGPNAAKDIAAHYLPNIVLGDGSAKTLYACLDASLSGTLEPLGAAALLPQFRQGAKVLAKLPISSIRLDDIQGLERVDWVVLDHRHDTLAAIAGGKRLLDQTLLIQVRLNIVSLYDGQAGLEAVSKALAQNGFHLLRLHEPDYQSHFSVEKNLNASLPKSQLMSVDAIYVPNEDRLAAFGENQKLKLAFLVHTVYGATDLAAMILQCINPDLAQRYLKAGGWVHRSSQANAETKAERNKGPQNHTAVSMHRPSEALGVAPPGIANSIPKDKDTIVIPDSPHMPDAAIEELRSHLRTCKTYLEYGTGGSSVLATDMGVPLIIGVESDLTWLTAVKKKLATYTNSHVKHHLFHIDIGPTGPWGVPISETHYRKWPEYSLGVWSDQATKPDPDLVLVDGRFRVACFLASVLHIKAGATILFDDYADRPYYHEVERVLKPTKLADRLAVFRRPDNVNTELTWSLLTRYATDHR